jgi:hypothetical protein
MTAPLWLEQRVIEGIQGLLVMRLEGAPAADTINATVDMWLEALMACGTTWQEDLDAARVTEAFRQLTHRREQWPPPRTLLNVMPARAPQQALPPPRSSTMSPEMREQLKKITKRQRAQPGQCGKHDLLAAMRGHIGKTNGASVAQLARQLNTEERHVRTLVTLLRMDGEHVCGHPKEGYYMAANDDELNATFEFLNSRAMKTLTLLSKMRRVALPDLIGQLRLPT